MFSNYTVLIKGGGDLGTAVAHKLYNVGFKVIISELSEPIMVRREASFSNCLYEGSWTVEGVNAKYLKDINTFDQEDSIVVTTLTVKQVLKHLTPIALIDATVSKHPEIEINSVGIVIGLGPGFEVGVNAHAIIETLRGHHLGRVIFDGKSEMNTGIPGMIKGCSSERVLRASKSGQIKHYFKIGDSVHRGDVISSIDDTEVIAEIDGMIRGLIHERVLVTKGLKIGDIDPRNNPEFCTTISDKGRTVSGGVLEALLVCINKM